MAETRSSTPPARSSIWRRALIAAIVLATLGTGAWFVRDRLTAPGDAVTAYRFATAQRGGIEALVTATGTLQPRNYVDVGAQVSGQIKRIHVETGMAVQAGDLLAEIDPTVLASRVDATRAQLRFQRAQLTERKTGLELARSQYRRQQNLMRDDATSTEALESARAAARSSAALVEALEAQIEQTESNLRADEANLDYARIYAPMAGTVVSISVRQGQTLNTNQQAPVILRIADLATMTVHTQVSEADVGKLRLGMPVYFTTLGGRGRRWHGTLDKIEPTPAVQNNVVLYSALFDVPNPDGLLMTQMTAQVFFVVDAASDGVLIPVSALDAARAAGAPRTPARGGPAHDTAPPGETQATVLVAAPDGTLEARSVELGVSNRVQVQITEGLAEGERVVSGSAPDAASRKGPAR